MPDLSGLGTDGTYVLTAVTTYDGLTSTPSAPFTFNRVQANRTLVQDSKSGVTTATFDALNRQSSEQVGGSGVSAMRFDYAYTARGEVSSVTRYSDLAGSSIVGTTTHDYDAAGRETHLVQKNGSGTILANYTYTYDDADRMETKVENGTTTSFAYDSTDQLTQDGATAYGYDATGNRTNNGYATTADNRITNDGTWTYTYDANGNVEKRSKGETGDTWLYGYDNRNQMTSAAYSATYSGTVTQRVTYVYDAFGNRIERDYWDGSTISIERYGMDGWDPAQPMPVGSENFNTWVDLDGSNNLIMRRVFGTQFDELIARQTSGGAVLWYLTDYQQSVRLLFDNSGDVVGTIAYSAFGQVTVSSGTLDRYRYTGREIDQATGQQFNRGRIYDPATGKWMSIDSLGFAGGDANLYRYVHNGPTTATDPSGRIIIAVGEEAKTEALRQLENTFQMKRDTINVVSLGMGGQRIWENSHELQEQVQTLAGLRVTGQGIWANPGGKKEMFAILPNKRAKMTKLPDQADPTLGRLWGAFWDAPPHFVAQVPECNLPGTFNPLTGTPLPLSVTGAAPWALLTKEQQEKVAIRVLVTTRLPRRTHHSNGSFRVRWMFELSRPAPEDGYIVQKVTFVEMARIRNIPGEQGVIPPANRLRYRVYWEAWKVKQGEIFDTYTLRTGTALDSIAEVARIGIPFYTDEGLYSNNRGKGWDNSVGVVSQLGEIRFYLQSITGDLGDPGGGLMPPQPNVVGFGGKNQVSMSGGLPSTSVPPSWWKAMDPNNGLVETERFVRLKWNNRDEIDLDDADNKFWKRFNDDPLFVGPPYTDFTVRP